MLDELKREIKNIAVNEKAARGAADTHTTQAIKSALGPLVKEINEKLNKPELAKIITDAKEVVTKMTNVGNQTAQKITNLDTQIDASLASVNQKAGDLKSTVESLNEELEKIKVPEDVKELADIGRNIPDMKNEITKKLDEVESKLKEELKPKEPEEKSNTLEVAILIVVILMFVVTALILLRSCCVSSGDNMVKKNMIGLKKYLNKVHGRRNKQINDLCYQMEDIGEKLCLLEEVSHQVLAQGDIENQVYPAGGVSGDTGKILKQQNANLKAMKAKLISMSKNHMKLSSILIIGNTP